jgi:hypothetical protein
VTGYQLPRITVAALAGLLVVAGVLTSMPGPAQASPSPSSLLRRALAAGEHEPSVHVATSSRVGSRSVSFSEDVAQKDGHQTITVTVQKAKGHGTVLLAGGTAYFKGDSFWLRQFVALPASVASKYAGDWIKVPRSNPAFSTVAEGVTVASSISELGLSSPLRLTKPTTVDGQAVVGIRGKSHGVGATLYVRKSGVPLPVSEVVAGSEGSTTVRASAVFSKWGETVKVSAPKHSVPVTAL